jgi:hypothetical protein
MLNDCVVWGRVGWIVSVGMINTIRSSGIGCMFCGNRALSVVSFDSSELSPTHWGCFIWFVYHLLWETSPLCRLCSCRTKVHIGLSLQAAPMLLLQQPSEANDVSSILLEKTKAYPLWSILWIASCKTRRKSPSREIPFPSSLVVTIHQ